MPASPTPNFLDNILSRLAANPDARVLEELHPAGPKPATAAQLLAAVASARNYLASTGLAKGDRCVLLAANSIDWAAIDLAAMSAGIIVVPMYSRQAPAELVTMMRDCRPKLICCGDGNLASAVRQAWPDAPPTVLLSEILAGPCETPERASSVLEMSDPVAIIYTSGTSGEAKGVVLTAANVTHMLSCTAARLDLLMGARTEPDNVFHYLPFCFAGSWILLLSCLSRSSTLRLNMDLTRIADDLRAAAPDYCLNVPQLLDRMRQAVEGQLATRGGLTLKLFRSAQASWRAKQDGAQSDGTKSGGGVSAMLGAKFIFPAIRKKLGPNLKALICGSAPLSVETQYFFMMLGIPVLQVYGLTETTAICTMDDPRHVEPGAVGPAIPGIEMKLGDSNEILVRGPNIFLGYWNRPEATANVMSGDWFHTGDQGELTASGNWRISGRLKNLLILSSGHNIAPEPLEEKLMRVLPGAQQVVLFGHGRSFLTALVTGTVERAKAESEVARFNSDLPHYRQVRAFHIEAQPLTIDSGLLTANGKLRRDAIAAHFRDSVEAMYRRKAE